MQLTLPARSRSWAWVVAVAVLFTVLYVRNAWVSDDAYITFRSVEQLHAGAGPRWNPHERVQVYSHPLWFLLLALLRWVSSAPYWNVIVLSWGVSLLALLALRPLFGAERWRWLLAVALLLSSKPFVDFTSSGLENPLTFLLLAFFARQVFELARWEGPIEARRLARMVLVAALLVLCRHDLALLAAPGVVWALLRGRHLGARRLGVVVLVGGAPFLAWTSFAIVYYGFPFPNTAYAKLFHGLPPAVLWRQGVHYLENALVWTPLSFAVVVAGVGVAWASRSAWRWLGWGMLLGLVYVVKIGGDFMSGRFLTPLLFLGAAALAGHARREWLPSAAGLLVLYNLAFPMAPWKTEPGYRHPQGFRDPESHGIIDEKGAYFAKLGVVNVFDNGVPPMALPEGLLVTGAIGRRGFDAGLERIVVDRNALADPFLARLPVTGRWRVGHYRREPPEGYLETIESGENRLVDADQRELWERLARVTQGPIWSAARWRAIVELNLRPRGPLGRGTSPGIEARRLRGRWIPAHISCAYFLYMTAWRAKATPGPRWRDG